MQIRQHRASDGQLLSYRVAGNPSGPVLLLQHGWMSAPESFAKVLPLLEDDFFLVLPDLRGHAGSRQVTTPAPSMGRLAEDVAELIAHERLPRLHFVGHSLGASVGFQFCRQFGTAALASFCNIDMTSRIVTDGDWKHGVFGDWDQARCRDYIAGLETGFVDALVHYLAISLNPPEPASTRERIEKMQENYDPPTCIALYGDLAQADYRDIYRALDLPLLNLYGAHSEFYRPDTADWHHRNNPQSTLVVFAHSGHFPQLTEPVRFAGTLKDFVIRVEGGVVLRDDA